MEQRKRTRNLLTKHYQSFPELQIQDVFKYIFQSALGCEHMISSLGAATEYIRKEHESCSAADKSLTEPLDGAYSRVSLSYLNCGLSAETLGKLFFASAKKEADGMVEIEKKLDITRELVNERVLPFSMSEFEQAAEEWKALGYPAIHHSDTFRLHYRPAYRVIANKYVTFLPLLAEIDKALQGGAVTLAIDGGSASGKTTLADILAEIYDCTVFHMDDFFLRPEQRTPERYAEIGGNVDRERFLEEILIPHSKNIPVSYRKFDCGTGALSSPIDVSPNKLTIIEGAYSMHPELAKYYDLSVFLDISPKLQRQRITKRNSPQMAERFFCEWIPLEQRYFVKTDIKRRSDLCITIDE